MGLYTSLDISQRQALYLVYICFGASYYSYNSATTTSCIAYDSFWKYLNLDLTLIGAFNAAFYAASAVGTCFNWWMPNKIGRIRTLQFSCIVSFVGVILQTAAVNYAMFIVGRVVGGIGVGQLFALCPVYASEIASPHLRGRVGALYSLNISFFFMVTMWLGLAFYFVPGNASWRLLFGLQLVPGLVVFAGSFFMPESPRYLALKGRYDECLEVLKTIHDSHTDHLFYEKEFHQIRSQIEVDNNQKLGVKKIFTKRSHIHRVAIIVSFFFALHCTGIVPLSNYQVVIYQMVGAGKTLSLILSGVWGIVSTLAVLTCGFWIDRIGRRNSLFLGYAIMITAGIIIVACWATFESTGDRTLAKVVNFGIFLTDYGFSGIMNSFGPAYGAEIFPTHLRSTGVAIGYFTFNVLYIVQTQTATIALPALGWKYFLIFLCLDCLFVVIIYFFYPETKGKTLEEIAGIFGDDVAETWIEASKEVGEEHGEEHVEYTEKSDISQKA